MNDYDDDDDDDGDDDYDYDYDATRTHCGCPIDDVRGGGTVELMFTLVKRVRTAKRIFWPPVSDESARVLAHVLIRPCKMLDFCPPFCLLVSTCDHKGANVWLRRQRRRLSIHVNIISL